jgi:DNA-directed RNA polymerase specialized sigma24 family protein
MRQVKQEFTLAARNAMLIDELYRKNGRAILAFVRRQVISLEEAEDIVLEVFVAALESDVLMKLGEQEQQAWLHRVARKKCIDHLRRTTRRPAVPLDTITEGIYDDDEREPDKLAVRADANVYIAPIIQDGIAYIVQSGQDSEHSYLTALDAATGTPKWTKQLSGYVDPGIGGSLVLYNNVIYMSTMEDVRGFSTSNGDKVITIAAATLLGNASEENSSPFMMLLAITIM